MDVWCRRSAHISEEDRVTSRKRVRPPTLECLIYQTLCKFISDISDVKCKTFCYLTW